jgi:hypothetical protein
MSSRMFPIQGHDKIPAGQVPWYVAEKAYEYYSQLYGNDQSLERLSQRGGFGWDELVSLLRRERPGYSK